MRISAIFDKATGDVYALHWSSEGDWPLVRAVYACSQCGAEYQQDAIENNDFHKIELEGGDSVEYITPNPGREPPYECPNCKQSGTLTLMEKRDRAELTTGEALLLSETKMLVEKTGNGVRVTHDPQYKINILTAVESIPDRAKVNVPIEIEGMGGKEIIGFEEKPESIITERKKEVIDTKRK